VLVGNWLLILQNKKAHWFHLQGYRVLACLTCEHGHIPEDENLHQHTPVRASNLTRLWRTKGLQELPVVA